MKHIFSILGLIFILSSCIKNNPDPVWLEINEWTLESNPQSTNVTGILTSNFNNAWVFVDNEFVGIFELPCKIPILKSGTQLIEIYPTIWNNGISGTKKIYPFVESYQLTTEMIPNETITINPVTRYRTTTTFWIEDFDGATNQIETDPNSVGTIQTSSDPEVLDASINGNAFGRITLSTAVESWVGYTLSSAALSIPRGQEVYLEIDYHTTNRITTGLLAVSPNGTTPNPYIQLNPQDEATVEWKKIYIDLREIVSASDQSALFQLSFQALLDNEDTEGEINIDNIKVVHF